MGALDGLRVVEAGLLVQGPQAAATLHDWGADVVKVELPGIGDQARWLPVEAGSTLSGYFVACNRGKRSVTLDLHVEAGREAFLRLVARADVLITNFTPGTMERWGLGYEQVAAHNPRLVYTTASTFGPIGMQSDQAGADLSGQAAGGLISTTGRDGGEVTPVGATIADHIGSQNLVSGILAALYARERTGRGQRVDTSLVGGQVWAQASEYTAYFLTGNMTGRANGSNAMIPGIYGIFPTSDGWVAVVGVLGHDRERFYELVGRADLAQRYAQPLYWEETKREVFRELDETFRTRTTAHWCELLAGAGLRHAPVRNHAEVVADPSVWENGYLVHAKDSEGNDVPVVAPPVRFSDTPPRVAATAPELGQHTEEVLLEVGYTWEDIAALRDAGAI